MNSRDPFFPGRAGPWAGYTPGTHSVYSSPPRFPYSNGTSSRSHQSYVPGGVVYGPSPFLDRDHSPTPPSYGRGGLDYYSTSRWTNGASPVSRRRAYPLEDEEDPDPVVFNAGVTFRMGREAHVHRHVDVQPAHATPEAPSAALTRQIDKFLRKSDHALDRYSSLMESRSSSGLAGRRGRSVTPGGGFGLDSPDTSLSLRAQRSTSAASIAVKAEKHLESLGPVGRRQTGPIAEREEDDDFDTSSSDSFDDLSDDTSADLSKVSGRGEGRTKGHGGVSGRTPAHQPSKSSLDDLSSDSDDEYFDVVPLPGLRPPPPPSSSSAASSRQPPQKRLLSPPHNPPAHSRSLPAVNKGPKGRAMGNNPAHISGPTQGTDTPSAGSAHGGDKAPTTATQAAAVPTPKTAPPPPPPSTTPPQPPTGHAAARGGAVAGKGDTLKKYQAPQPPKDPKDLKDSKDSKDVNDTKDNKGSKDARNTKESQDTKDIKDAKDTKNNKQENKAGVQENKRDKQESDVGKQGDKQNKSHRPEANKENKQQCDSPEKVSQNKGNTVEAPPTANTAITPVSGGVTSTSGEAENALGATPKPRRAPSFKKYPAPQPPASPARPKSESVTLSAAREDITAASSGSVPNLLQSSVTGINAAPSPPGGEKKSPDTLARHSGGKVETEAVGVKQPPQTLTGGSPGSAPSTRKVRAGSPVPEKMSVAGKKAAAAPVVTGKLEIATGDGEAKVKPDETVGDKVSLNIKTAAKEDDKGGGDKTVPASKSAKVESKGEAAVVENKKIPNGDLALSPSPEETLGKKTQGTTKGKLTKTTDTASTGNTQQQDNTIKDKTTKLTKTEKKPSDEIIENHVTTQPQDNTAKGKTSKAAKIENKPPDKVIENHFSNGTQEAGEGKGLADDHSKYKKMNGTHHEEDPISARGETRSRSSSVASDITSPDVSQKSSGSKRSRSGKLAGIMNKFEVEEPKGNEKVKPKTKVGKISGLASVFESGKEPASPKFDLGSLKSPERKAPEPKSVNIAGISTSKFGSVAKFKKPVDPKKEESKPLSSEENDKSKKESTEKKDQVNGVTETAENKQEIKKPSEKTDKSNKECVKKKDEVNGVTENTENDKEIKKPSEKTEKSSKESGKKKDEVNGVIENAENNQIKKPLDKTDKTKKESSVKKKDQVNGVSESCENDQESKKPPDKNNKESSVRKKDYVNGICEGVENDQENKTKSTSRKTEKSSETTSTTSTTKKKGYVNGVCESVDSDQGVKKPRKPEKETEIQVKTKEKLETDAKKKSVVSEVHETLTNGDLLSDESSLSSACEIEEKDVTTAAPSAPVTPAAAGRGGATEGATSKGSAKLRLAKEGDTEAKITLGRSGSAKGTKDSDEKEAVSKGAKGKVEGKTDGTEAPTVKGVESLATTREAAKSHAAKVDKSHSKSTKAEAAEREVTVARGADCQPLDVTKVKQKHVPGKDEPITTPKSEGTSAAHDNLKKNIKEATLGRTLTSLTTKTSSGTAADKAVADVKVQDTKTVGGEKTVASITAETSKETSKESPGNTATPNTPALHTNSSLSPQHKPEGDKIEIRVIPKAAITDQPLTKIKVIAKATVSDQQLTITTTTAEDTQDTVVSQALSSSASVEGLGVPNSSSAPQLSTLDGGASGFSWKTNRIRRKLDYAIENTESMLPRMESEVEDLVREASDYLGPERRARRSWTPTFPGTTATRRSWTPTFQGTTGTRRSCTPSITGITGTRRSLSPIYTGTTWARRSLSPSITGIPCSRLQLAARSVKSHGDDDEEVYEDALDPSQLDTLMPLPDVQVEREQRSRSRTPMEGPERSLSSNSMVAQAESLLSETDRLLRRSRSDKSLRRSYSRSLSSAALNKSAQEVLEAKCDLLAKEMLAEVTADLSEEHNTAHLAGERLEAEQAERMKLEKEVERLQNNMRMMTTANGKLEMEKQALQSEVLNGEADHDEEEAADASLYRRKYEWCLREIELLKKQLKQQQEDDLDHLLLLKKQLEKKVADAYEETEEQRQVVAQVKRKSQRLQAEMNDIKILLEEQTSRNNLLEKKQRKFDQDMMAAQEELRHERTSKEKVQREKDQILSEKYSFEQEVATLKLELELKEEKLTALNRQLEDLNFTGKSEEEVAVLKKAKHDLELRVKDQEEELDDLAGQVQMLEGAKVRLEMSIEQMRKENRREVSQREEELEEVRLSAQKKVKALESQLENEHEERTLLVREKHELERRVSDLQDRNVGHVDEEYVHKLKKELKKTKALLRDTQTMLEKSQSEGGQKLLVRQLKTQLEDAEFAKTAAIKARQCADADLSDLTTQLEEAQRARKEAEDRCARIGKERAEIQTQLEESEEEVAEVMKKYKSVVSQLSVDQITLSEQTQQIAELEHEKQVLHERLMELSSKVEVLEGETANIHTQRRLELKIKEVESKLELEQTTRQRLESQIGRLKDQLERVSGDCDSARLKEAQAVEHNKRVARQLRDAKEDLAALQQRHTDVVNKKSEMEKQLELADSEVATLKSDLKLAFKRIEDLQQAIQGDLNDSDSDLSDSDSDSDGSLSSYLTASLKQQMSSSNSTLRTPPSEVHQLDRAEQPTSPCSEAISEDLEEAAAARESFA